jgi:hypothetical protein
VTAGAAHQPDDTSRLSPVGGGVIRALRLVAAAVLALHGVVHLLGFVAQWQLATLAELPYRTTILDGAVDIGATGARIEGLGWLVLVPAWLVAAYALARDRSWALVVIGVVSALSLGLCLLAMPYTRIGMLLNVGILAVAGYILLMIRPAGARATRRTG